MSQLISFNNLIFLEQNIEVVDYNSMTDSLYIELNLPVEQWYEIEVLSQYFDFEKGAEVESNRKSHHEDFKHIVKGQVINKSLKEFLKENFVSLYGEKFKKFK